MKDLQDVVDQLVDHFKACSAHLVPATSDKALVYPVEEDKVEGNLAEQRQAKYIGATQVPVSKDFFQLLQLSDACPTLDRLWEKVG